MRSTEAAFAEPAVTEMANLRNQRRRNHRQITYDCLIAAVGEDRRVTCLHAPRSIGLLAVLRGDSMACCHQCSRYRDDGREE